MRHGDIVTRADLSARFDALYRRANNLTGGDFRALSTGQVFIFGANGIRSEVLSVSCEQFFDTMTLPDYTLYEDGQENTYGSDSFLQSIIDEISAVENK